MSKLIEIESIRHPVGADGTMAYRFTFNVAVNPHQVRAAINPHQVTDGEVELGRRFVSELHQHLTVELTRSLREGGEQLSGLHVDKLARRGIGCGIPYCCHIGDEGQRLLKQPGLSSGDERQIIDQHGCQGVASWEIYGGGSYDNVTHACDAHVGALLTEGASNTVYPIPLYDTK